MQDTILLLSQDMSLAGLIARTLRWRQVYCVIQPMGTPMEAMDLACIRGVVIAHSKPGIPLADQMDPKLLSSGLPVLALGAAAVQLSQFYGGDCSEDELQACNTNLTLEDDELFDQLTGGERMLYSYLNLTLPECLNPIAFADQKPIGFRHAELPQYGFQYTIERNDPDGAQILSNFACRICGCQATWDDDSIIDQALAAIRNSIPDDGRVLCAVSGGVDSAVCARLASLAVGTRLTCVFVDTGLFHQDEPQTVIADFMETMGIVVAYVDARELFLQALTDVTDSKQKERIASSMMTQVLLNQFTYEPDIHTLIMGTNYNDTLYGLSPTAEIDSARGALDISVLEPVRNLFKDEVRRLALALKLPPAFASRQPFPASGLALRIFGEVTPERLTILRTADAYLCEEITAGGLEKRLWQFYTNLLRSPDNPSRYSISLRVLQAGPSSATSARLPFDLLERVTQRILSEISSVSRVVYDLTPSYHYGELE